MPQAICCQHDLPAFGLQHRGASGMLCKHTGDISYKAVGFHMLVPIAVPIQVF